MLGDMLGMWDRVRDPERVQFDVALCEPLPGMLGKYRMGHKGVHRESSMLL